MIAVTPAHAGVRAAGRAARACEDNWRLRIQVAVNAVTPQKSAMTPVFARGCMSRKGVRGWWLEVDDRRRAIP